MLTSFGVEYETSGHPVRPTFCLRCRLTLNYKIRPVIGGPAVLGCTLNITVNESVPQEETDRLIHL